MMLIVGLGNPGEQLKNTRHNVGREIAMAFQHAIGCADFRFEKKWNALVSEGSINKEKLAILLPETMMNKSGAAIAPAARFFKVKPDSVFVVHDDADIAFGKAKLSFAKNSAGHKGVESVIRALKTNAFWRFRIGIAGKRDIPAEKLVLKKFMPEEQKIVKKIGRETLHAIGKAISESPEIAMNEYNKKT
ncbi:MAG: aminoacyl-tRNA hydrolase [Candidatus Sungbacteria bacterium]|nr:aminoacyl-tRNA hydrolase [Candidatus Sungbacteria bacterium]